MADRGGRDDGLAERLRRPNCLVASQFCRRERACADHCNGHGSQPRMASRTRRTCARAAPILGDEVGVVSGRERYARQIEQRP